MIYNPKIFNLQFIIQKLKIIESQNTPCCTFSNFSLRTLTKRRRRRRDNMLSKLVYFSLTNNKKKNYLHVIRASPSGSPHFRRDQIGDRKWYGRVSSSLIWNSPFSPLASAPRLAQRGTAASLGFLLSAAPFSLPQNRSPTRFPTPTSIDRQTKIKSANEFQIDFHR